jgi:hypothetical protein
MNPVDERVAHQDLGSSTLPSGLYACALVVGSFALELVSLLMWIRGTLTVRMS